jgi:hypothetical protein
MHRLRAVLIIVWVILPQVACFVLAVAMVQPEMECCKEMVSAHSCCRDGAQSDAAIAPQIHQKFVRLTQPVPIFHFSNICLVMPDRSVASEQQKQIQAPPGDTHASSTILRI